MMDSSSLPYRHNVGIMLLNRDGKVWVGRRVDGSDGWQMPQGGIDAGEDPSTAARREMLEEIGTDKAEIIHESADWYRYDLPPDLIGKVWKGKYRGQQQKWVVMRFTGRDEDIVLTTDHPEFLEWRWVSPEMLPDLVVPFKRDVYTAVLHDLLPVIGSVSQAATFME